MSDELNNEIEIVHKYIYKTDDPVNAFDGLLSFLLNQKDRLKKVDRNSVREDILNTAKELVFLSSEEKFRVLTKAWEVPGKSSNIVIPGKVNKLLSELLKVIDKPGKYLLSSHFSYGLMDRLAFNFKNSYNIIVKHENELEINNKLYALCGLDYVQAIKGFDKLNPDVNVNLVTYAANKIDIQRWARKIKSTGDRVDLISKEYKIDSIEYIDAQLLKSLLTLRDDGIMLSIVPNGVLTNRKYTVLRSILKQYFQLISIIELPKSGLFANVDLNASILIVKNSSVDPKEVFLAKFDGDDFKEEMDSLMGDLKEFIKGVNLS